MGERRAKAKAKELAHPIEDPSGFRTIRPSEIRSAATAACERCAGEWR